MLSEITGSLPATNVRDNIIRDIDTIHSIQSITNSSYCRRWTFNVRWTVIYLGLSEYRTLHYWFQRRRPYFPSWRHVAMNLQRRRIPDDSPREHWTQNIAHGTCTLNTSRMTSHDIVTSVPSPSVFVFLFGVFRWTELYWRMRSNDIVGYLNCITVSLRNVDVLISVW